MLLLFVEKIVLDRDQSNKYHELTLKPQSLKLRTEETNVGHLMRLH